MRGFVAIVAFSSVVLGSSVPSFAQLGPPPIPAENPITEPKRILGKLLFWDEQLSSADTISCGGCHQPNAGGGDIRISIHPGPDLAVLTPDDIRGSAGVVLTDALGVPVSDPIFGFNPQVTNRSAPTVIGAAYAIDTFWDGRASSTFMNPETGTVSIQGGGGLESQAVQPFLSPVEMARQGRTWDDVRAKLQHSLPMRDGTDLPPDLDAVVASHVTYPQLFAAAFGDQTITAERIAFAIATYERTLVPDLTPWDRFVNGETTAMTAGQIAGWDLFRTNNCKICHLPPQFSDQSFHNIGMRPVAEDQGRMAVTHLPSDGGRFKVPTLRNTGLKPSHAHNGRTQSTFDAARWYGTNNAARSTENLDPLLPVNLTIPQLMQVADFLSSGLTDPRVLAETFPFDRPAMHRGNLPKLSVGTDHATFSWPALTGIQRYHMYRGTLEDLRTLGPDGLPAQGFGTCVSTSDPNTADTTFVDPAVPPAGEGFFYLKSVIDAHGVERGLGATSDGRAHIVVTPCPPGS